MDFDLNSPLFGLIIRLAALLIFLYIFILQLIANYRYPNWDQYSVTRLMLTFLLSGKIILLAPGIAYLFIRLAGGEDEVLRSIATFTTSLAFLFTAVNLLMIYIQKEKR